ncbi:MAG: glycosyl transferase, partial [Sporolactobacillus laevolacticus]|nr:glycosyl transferase [Sporolactobacillus laevolacticus]
VFLIALLALSFYGSEKYIAHSITRQRPAEIQLIFQNAGRNAHVKHMNVYLGDRLTWQQSTYLSALLYGQFQPRDGGLFAFTQAHDNKSLLLLSNNAENKRMIASKHYQIVMRNAGYYLIKKK